MSTDPKPSTDTNPLTVSGRIRAFRERHSRVESILFFAGGFVFDAIMLKRIDEPGMLAQQGVYLLLTGGLIALTQRYFHRGTLPPAWLRRPWHYVDHAVHFMMGTLLNAYTIFYFQSASGLTAFGFLVVVACLLAVNEMPRFHKLGPVVLYALYSICLTSYLAYLIPVLAGSIRPWMFYVAVAGAMGPLVLHVRWLSRWSKSRRLVARQVLAPALGVQVAFVLLYAFRIAPPVPLAVQEMGIYHDVKREPGGRRLYHEDHGFRFWLRGDQDFRERPGDKLWCFARVFAPARFDDQVFIVWYHRDVRRGWQRVQRLPLGVRGRRNTDRGFATEAYLTSPVPGDWRVELESEDGRTMGQLGFTVTLDEGTEPRDFVDDFSPTRAPNEKPARS